MAASAVKNGDFLLPGNNGKRAEYGYVTFDSDATVEVNTGLTIIECAAFTPTGSGGNAATLSIDETVTGGRVAVPTTGAITVDATGNTTDTWQYLLIGY